MQSQSVQTFSATCPHGCLDPMIVELTRDMHTGAIIGMSVAHTVVHPTSEEWLRARMKREAEKV